MAIFKCKGKTYEIDDGDFLMDHHQWDKNFAEGMARRCGIPESLTSEHWEVIYFIRNTFIKTGQCPIIFEACRMNSLDRRDLKRLFPTGYLRGACKLAGITYQASQLDSDYVDHDAESLHAIAVKKAYRTNVMGFLIDPQEWDERWASQKAYELMKIPGGKLIERQWELIRYLRQRYEEEKRVPTVYETCEDTGVELDVLQSLFPDGYHRGLVKIAGLKVH